MISFVISLRSVSCHYYCSSLLLKDPSHRGFKLVLKVTQLVSVELVIRPEAFDPLTHVMSTTPWRCRIEIDREKKKSLCLKKKNQQQKSIQIGKMEKWDVIRIKPKWPINMDSCSPSLAMWRCKLKPWKSTICLNIFYNEQFAFGAFFVS